ncbi:MULTISPECIES: carbohydrate ABC transporter permease [Arthrobacter]|uniref:Sugar ABC transporter permease n=1 Tax=Arthrobacter terricola TaxID=2547396 RepID=A0A4R5KG85_9MICC|nr:MULTISPECIES: sugar ABC transporter permease [Arthrobacter]MBT8162423.1 sugar ABC transporter permease [Arthrobacter sp. GN70]TDF93327.1 sugar ABC transporter permease [Arthrobacter terricola]
MRRTARTSARRESGGRAAALFLAPFMVLFALTMIAPIMYALVLSLLAEKKSGLGFAPAATVFAGLGNYAAVLGSQTFLDGLARLGAYCLMYIPVMIGLALVLALLMDTAVARARKVFQLVLFLPHAVPGIIAAIVWVYLYTPSVSPIVEVLSNGGIAVDFLDAHLVLPAIVNVSVWEWTGYNVVILFTALQAVPRETIEAATVDGAGGLRTALSIKVPLVSSAIGVIALFTIIGTLQLFTEPTMMHTATSSVTSTYVPNMWAYDAAFNQHNLNQAAAASLILAVLAAALSFIVTRWTSRSQKP